MFFWDILFHVCPCASKEICEVMNSLQVGPELRTTDFK